MRLAAIFVTFIAFLMGCSSSNPNQAHVESTSTGLPRTVDPTPTQTAGLLTVVIDPGHGGTEVGASANGVVEKDSNLDMARRVQFLLEARGIRVALTRTADSLADGYTPDPSLSGRAATRQDLQARVDLANQGGADLFISLHSNGSTNVAESGVEVWFDPNRPFGEENKRLASTLQRSVLDALDAYGYDARDRGIKDDSCFRIRSARCRPLYVLGPARTDVSSFPPGLEGRPPFEAYAPRATAMPGALVELLFISNPADAAVLRHERARNAIARGLTEAILAFLFETSADSH